MPTASLFITSGSATSWPVRQSRGFKELANEAPRPCLLLEAGVESERSWVRSEGSEEWLLLRCVGGGVAVTHVLWKITR